MTDRQERSPGGLRTRAWIVIGTSLVWRSVRAFADVFLTHPPESDTAAAPQQEATADERIRTGKWLMLGALLSWKAGKSLAKKTAKTLLEEPGAEERAASPAPASIEESRPRSEQVAKPPSDSERMLVASAVVGWEALRLSVAAVGHAVKRALLAGAPVKESPHTGRDADRDLDRENAVNLERRTRWGTVFATAASLLGLAGGVSFVVNFWTGGRNEWLGGSLAVFLGGFGASLVLWAHWLTAHREAVEPREQVASQPRERQSAAAEFRSGAGDIQRRRLLQWLSLAGLGALGAVGISLVRALGFPPYMALDTDVWKRGQRLMTVDGVPVSVNSLQPGGMIVVFPENSIGSEKSQTVLVRVRQDLLRMPAERSNWAPLGYLAYSRICTHAGCSVGMYEANSHLLMCPCHQSTFDVLTAARPTSGPAARSLPQLPLYVDGNGHLRAAAGFSAYPGPGFWGIPS